MRRQAASRFDHRGFLLIEAGLAVAAVAVGLAVITQAIAGSLKTLTRLQAHDGLLQYAESLLTELELDAQQGPPLSRRDGPCEAVGAWCRWQVSSEPAELPADEIPEGAFHTVTVAVGDLEGTGPVIRLRTLWPTDWIAE